MRTGPRGPKKENKEADLGMPQVSADFRVCAVNSLSQISVRLKIEVASTFEILHNLHFLAWQTHSVSESKYFAFPKPIIQLPVKIKEKTPKSVDPEKSFQRKICQTYKYINYI